jgi:hypothetical protein
MANNTVVPNLGRVRVLSPNPNCHYDAATNDPYAIPLDHSKEATWWRTDLWPIVGQVVRKRALYNHPQNPVCATVDSSWKHRTKVPLTKSEVEQNVTYRMARNRNKILKNVRSILWDLVDHGPGSAAIATMTEPQRRNLFLQFYQQDPFSITEAMFRDAGDTAVRLDAIFNGRNTVPIGHGTTLDQVIVLQQWFEYLFVETCEIMGPLSFHWRPAGGILWADRQRISRWMSLRPAFLTTFSNTNPQGINLLDPRNLPI